MTELAVVLTVAEVVDELFGLPPRLFVDARQRRADELRSGGDAGGADSILALTRPTAGAWMSNQLVRWSRAEVLEFVDLGRALRVATDRLDGAELWSLNDRRRRAYTALVNKAEYVAVEGRVAVNPTSRRGLADTLQAAICSAEMAERMLTGRLTRSLAKISWPGLTATAFRDDLARRRAMRLAERPAASTGRLRDDDDDDDAVLAPVVALFGRRSWR